MIICLSLLAIVSIGCYCYNTGDWLKKNTWYHNNIKSSTYIDDIIKIEDFDFNNTSLDEQSYKRISVYDIS